MPAPKRNPTREARIINEIVVDAYTESERAMGWYYYLDNQLQFPFSARCVRQRAISPLGRGDTETRRAVEDWHYWVARDYSF